MIKFNFKLNKIQVNRGAFSKTLNHNLEVLCHNAARQFLKGVVPLVPVWSGMAKASLMPLASVLHVALSVSPRAEYATMSATGKMHKRTPPDRTSEGMASSNSDFFYIDEQAHKFEFRWKSSVYHFNVNDQIDPRPFGIRLTHQPIPWHAVEAGRRLANLELKYRSKGIIPNLADFVYTTNVGHNPKYE